MRVFISWSGEKSQKIANVFRSWLPAVLQTVKPYFSPEDLDKGTKWSNEISKQLQESRIGIICVTNENINAPWILFEAGAISKTLETSKVCPILFGVDQDILIKSPISQFQCTNFDKEGIRKLIRTINSELNENELEIQVLNSVFDKWWPDLENQIKEVISSSKESDLPNSQKASERELLEEILGFSRSIHKRISIPQRLEKHTVNQAAVSDLIESYSLLCEKSSASQDHALI